MQQNVILWLAALPLVLAMFRAITIGDRLYSPVQTGLAGGHHKQHVNAMLAGSCILTLLVIPVLGGNTGGGLGALEDTIAFTIMAFGAFVVSAYMAAGFRGTTWQKFVGHALHEAGLYWLVLAVCSLVLLLTERPTGGENNTPQGPVLQFLQFAVWGVLVLVTVVLIVGTAARMRRR